MLLNHIILALLWIIFCVLHSVLASQPVKRMAGAFLNDKKWYRLWYTVFAFVTFAALLLYEIQLRTKFAYPSSTIMLVIGGLLAISGLIVMVICIRKYFMNVSGVKGLFLENAAEELHTGGLHRYVRHPLYLGTFAFIWGLFVMMPYYSLLISNVIITVYTVIAIDLEERKLVTQFGDSYVRYRNSVPKLIPFSRPKNRQVKNPS